MAKVITDEQYMDAIQKVFNEKLKQFQEAGGWDVINEKAQHCTYHRYLEAGAEDCENTAKLIESLMVTLDAVKREMQAEVERLEARQLERTNFTKMVEVIDSVTKNIGNISESCTKNTNIDDKQVEELDQVILLPSNSVNLEAQVSGLQITASTSRSNQSSIFKQAQKKPNKTLIEKLCRPPTSKTGSFTVNQDEDTVKFLDPVRLTFHDTTTGDSVRSRDGLDQITDNLKKEDVGSVRKSESPVMESELAKQWIREVTFKQTQRKPTEIFVEKLYRPPASLTGSFTMDQDEDTVTFLEPVRVLTFQDTTMDDTVIGKNNLDQITDNLKKRDVEPARISEPPVMESELAKGWIREIALKQSSFTVDQEKDTVMFLEPMRVLTSQDTKMDDTVRGEDDLDQITKNLKKEDVGSVRISESPVMESELAKQWIREVVRKML
ncbi:unnamed protein product [Cercopithifilaria johnstoni]|uniref:Uncharacterized protein n=1 Tax=Cercopithifilaria johnstoni TaxID=2874296 RepID=A0A8J2MQR2_9BILA|nr:unnamed protein product [Cercopithifilaria johnstoni]